MIRFVKGLPYTRVTLNHNGQEMTLDRVLMGFWE